MAPPPPHPPLQLDEIFKICPVILIVKLMARLLVGGMDGYLTDGATAGNSIFCQSLNVWDWYLAEEMCKLQHV